MDFSFRKFLNRGRQDRFSKIPQEIARLESIIESNKSNPKHIKKGIKNIASDMRDVAYGTIYSLREQHSRYYQLLDKAIEVINERGFTSEQLRYVSRSVRAESFIYAVRYYSWLSILSPELRQNEDPQEISDPVSLVYDRELPENIREAVNGIGSVDVPTSEDFTAFYDLIVKELESGTLFPADMFKLIDMMNKQLIPSIIELEDEHYPEIARMYISLLDSLASQEILSLDRLNGRAKEREDAAAQFETVSKEYNETLSMLDFAQNDFNRVRDEFADWVSQMYPEDAVMIDEKKDDLIKRAETVAILTVESDRLLKEIDRLKNILRIE